MVRQFNPVESNIVDKDRLLMKSAFDITLKKTLNNCVKHLFILLALTTNYAIACPDIQGIWKSSKKETMEFTKEWESDSKRLEFYSQIFGLQIIEFKKDHFIIYEIPKKKISIEGKEYDWSSEREVIKYKVVGCNSKQVVIQYKLSDLDWIQTMNFVDENMYWEYTGSVYLPQSHTREFYKRITLPDEKTNGNR
jgi:hypothetical protein